MNKIVIILIISSIVGFISSIKMILTEHNIGRNNYTYYISKILMFIGFFIAGYCIGELLK